MQCWVLVPSRLVGLKSCVTFALDSRKQDPIVNQGFVAGPVFTFLPPQTTPTPPVKHLKTPFLWLTASLPLKRFPKQKKKRG